MHLCSTDYEALETGPTFCRKSYLKVIGDNTRLINLLGDLPSWWGAKRLALNPPTSAWGRSMLAKRGGLAVQRKYLLEGRHPTEKATQVRLAKQRRRAADPLARV